MTAPLVHAPVYGGPAGPWARCKGAPDWGRKADPDDLFASKRGPHRFVTCPRCRKLARRRAFRGVLDVPWAERLRDFFEATSR